MSKTPRDTEPAAIRPPYPHPSGIRPPEIPRELVPRHVAIVMDGDGRWAKERGLPRTEGHKVGEAALMDVLMGAIELGVKYISAYAFSTENWRRHPDEVAFLLAKKMRSNVRDLEGALNTLAARANFTGRTISIEFAQETLRDLLRAQQQAIGIPNIQKTVADYYGLQMKDLLSKRRTRSLARPRQVAMALAKELTEHSLPEIGDAFAGRDHTTVLHACRQIRTLMETDGKLREDWDKLIRKLSE